MHGRRPFALITAAVALAAVALLLLAQLAGRPAQHGTTTPTAAFLTKALGSPQASAPIVRKPRPGIRVELRRTGYAVARDGFGFTLDSTEPGSSWHRFRNGSVRTTAFGSETTLVGWTKTEQFLTVEKRQGPKTWTWNLASDDLTPALRTDGGVEFRTKAGKTASLSLLPARVLDEAGRDVTPDDTRWSLRRGPGGWLLALALDDSDLTVPYVIDPAADYPATLELRNTATTVTGGWDMDSSTGTADATTITQPARNATGYWEFDPGTLDSTQLATPTETDQGWIVDAGANNGSANFPGGTWTFTLRVQALGTGGGTGYITYALYKGTIASGAFTPTQTLISPTDYTGVNIATQTTATNVSFGATVGAFALTAGETIYAQFWRHQTGGNNSNSALNRQVTLTVNDGNSQLTHPAADDTNPTVSYSLTSQSPAGSSYLNGSTMYYRGTGGGSGGSFSIRSTVSDAGSGPASATTMDALSSGGWTHTASTVSTPAGGPFDSNTLTWTEGSSSSPTERVYGTDLSGRNSSTTTFTMTNDSGAPPDPVTTFPVAATAYRTTTWNAGCGTNGFCGTAAADGAAGLREVQLSIRRGSGNYWDGSGFNSGSQVWVTATGTSTWSYTFPASSFPADDSYTVTVRSVDNVNNTGTASAITFTYDGTAPSAPSSLGTTPNSPANDNDPRVTGTAEAGSTVDLYATADCTGGVAASGSAATFGGAGLDPANVSDNTTTSYTAKTTDAAGNVSACSSSSTYVEDSDAPSAPSSLGTSPASPANNNDPRITGAAEADSTVTIYATGDCSGGSVGSGSAATFGGAGLDTTNVADDSTTDYTSKATDAAGNVSTCSSAVTYVEDSTAPGAPTGLATSPVSPANDNDPEVTGAAEAGSTVRIYTTSDCSGAPAATGTAATFGAAGISVNVANDSTSTLKATATDPAGNASSCSSGVAYVEDSTAPSAPTGLGSSPASPANDNDPELTGSTEAGSTVRLHTTSDCSGAPAATGTAATFGGAGLSVNVANDSTTTFKATATDAAGNASGCSSGYMYVEDSTAPSAPNGLATSPVSPSNDNNPEVTGSAEAGSTVRLYTTSDCSGAATATGTAATFGGAGITAAVGADTTTTFKATATDAAGNPSACSSGVAYLEDSTAPSAPSISASSPASPGNDNDPELSGSAEAGSTVRLYTNATCTSGIAGTGSAATFGGAGVSVNVGNDSTTSFYATATDAAGNPSGCSVTPLTYVEDSTAPSAPTGLATSPVSPSNVNNPDVTGSAEAGSTVRLYTTSDCSGAATATGTAATFGGAGITAAVGADTTTTFKATATDAAGNASSCSSGVDYVEDSTAPSAPSALNSSPGSPASDNDPEMTGSAEASSTVRLYTTSDCSGASTATGTAAAFAAPGLSVNVAADSSTTFKATATDVAGNTSACSSGYAYVEDSTTPNAPSGLATSPASPANDNDPAVTGSAEAGATVRVYTTSDCSGAPSATGTAATFGGAGLSVSVANDSTTTFKATATDAAGNTSACSSGVAYVEDSTAPSSTVTFPASGGTYSAAGWSNVAGTAGDGSGSGLQRVEISIRRVSTGLYWNGTDFTAAGEDWRTASGTASWSLGFAVGNFPAEGDYTVRVRAVDNAPNAEAPSSRTFTLDTQAPGAPNGLASAPASPANDNDPELTGSAEAGSTVRIYTTNDCSGAATATGTAAAFGGAGLSVNVGADSTTTFKATATDASGNTSACSTGLAYVEDSTAPSAPTALATTPASPAYDNDPELTGSAEAGSTVRIYTTNDCSGAATATGTAAAFGGAGLSVNVGADSTTTFKATATDAAGNTSSCSAGVAYVEDSTDPSSTVSFPSAGVAYTASSWNDFGGTASDGTGSGLQRVELSIRRDSSGLYWNGTDFTAASEDWRTASGTSSWSLAFAAANFAADGAYTVRVRAVDNAGNLQAPSTRTFTIDRATPNTQLDSGPSNPSNNANPSFSFSASEGGVTFECRIDGGSWSACASPKSYSSLGEAPHTFEVRATDGAGNTDASPASQTWTLDLTDPASVFAFPAAGGSYNTAGWNDFSGTASDSGGAGLQRVELSIRRVSTGLYWNGTDFTAASEDWRTASGTSSWTLSFAAASFPSDGDYTVRLRAVDNASNTHAPLSRTFTVDTVAPETTIDTGPSGPTSNVNASLTFSADQPGATFECRLDGGSWASCTSPKSYASLTQGAHTFDVRATDPGNNADASPASRAWTVDTVPPTATTDNPGAYLRGTVTLSSTTADTGGTGIASVTYERSPAGAGSWTGVAGTWNTTSTADGLYDLHIVAIDQAGNTTTSVAVTNVRVDNTAPSVTMNSPGAAVSGTVALSSTNDDFGGSGVDNVQFQYKESSGSSWTNTPAGWDTTVLTDGDYDVRAIGTDRAGNTTTSAATSTIVDNTDPTIAISAPPDGGFVNGAAPDPFTFTANANDTGSGVASVEFWTCDDTSLGCSSGNWTSLGSDATAPYGAGWPLPAEDGNRALRARATDEAGRTATAVIGVTIDRTVPDTTLLTNPGTPSNDTTPAFTFSSNEAGASFECRVDAGPWAACGSPHTTGTLSDGTRTFEVRATDLAGNIDATPASWTWLLDATAPSATMNDPGANLRGLVNLTSSQSDTGSGVASVEYEYSVADANTWVGISALPWDTTEPTDGLYDVRVVVVDNAGNETQSTPVEDRRIDNAPPASALDDPGANLRATVTLRSTASDSGSGVAQVAFEYSVDGSSWSPLPGGSDSSAPYEYAFDTTALTDGLYFFRPSATDVAGNASSGAAVGPRRIDNTVPIAVMNDPGAYLRGTVNLTSTADDPGGSGVATVVYNYAGPESGTTSGTWATDSVQDGVYDLTVTVTDIAGNVTISNVVAGRRVDNTAPSTGHNAPGGWQSSAVTVSLSPSDGGSGVANTQFAVDGGGWQSGTSVNVTGDGIHTISFFSTDAAGNVESPKTATVSIDTTPPDAGAMDPGNYLRGAVTLSANPSDDGAGAGLTGIEFQHKRSSDPDWTSLGVDTDSPYSAVWNTTPAEDGSWDLRFVARDDATPPNEDVVDMNSKIVDNTAPTGSVSSPLAGATVSGDVTLGVTANDASPIVSVEYFVNGGSVGNAAATPYQVTWNSAAGGDGAKSIHAVITDVAGNSHTTGGVNVTSDNFAPTVSVDGLPANVRGTVALQASASGDTVSVAYQARQLPSGGWSGVASAGGAPWTVNWTPPTDGGWEVRAIATDAGGNSGTSAVVQTTVDNTNPSGVLTRPSNGNRVGGSAVPLEANASDGGSGVDSVTWQARPSGGGFADIASDASAPYAATWDVTSLPSVAHDLQIVVTDRAGNTFTSPFITVDVDSTAPTVVLNNPGSPVSGTVALTATTGGDADAVTFGRAPAGSASWTAIATDGTAPYGANFDTTGVADGVYDLRAVVTDAAGNTSQSVVPGIRVDNLAPVVVDSTPSHGSIVASASSISITASEAIASLSGVELDGAPAPPPVVSGSSATFNTGALANGSHTLSGTVSDAAGKSSAFSISFVVGVPVAPPSEGGEDSPFEGFPLVPAPADFNGVFEDDGTLTLRWTPAEDADGKPLATILYVDDLAMQSVTPGESEVNLGAFDPADMRVFSIAAVDAEGNASAPSARLRSTSLLAGKPLADVEAILVNRGFELGDVVGSGSVVAKPVKPLMAGLASAVDLELGEPEAPQTKLVFEVVGTKKFSWSTGSTIAIRTKVTRASRVTAVLLSPSGTRVYRWRFDVKAGTSVLRLKMPPQVRKVGKYRLVFTVQSGRDVVKKTIVVEIVGRTSRPARKPVEIVLAGRSDVAGGLKDDGLRVFSAADADDTFGLTGSASRDVQVVVIDVDRYGIELVRDLCIVFPNIKVIALSNDPRKLAQAMRLGATMAVPRSTPPKDLAKVIAQAAKRR